MGAVRGIFHYLKRAVELGPKRTVQTFENRLKTTMFERYWRYKASIQTASFSWKEVKKKLSIDDSFEDFLQELKLQNLTQTESELGYEESIGYEKILANANEFANNKFDLIGSGPIEFKKIPWHSDFRLHNQNPDADHVFDPNKFYKDIQNSISAGKTEELEKDIKVPWELSRFHHLFIIGQAYKTTGDEKYAKVFVDHITDWLDENPFLLGPNWACPMDVGLRAINWTWGFHFFKESKYIDTTFWKAFVCSLYDHMFYLENNWEIYDTVTSNHYLSDLAGYFYLCWFFKGVDSISKKKKWCYKRILQEFEKQVSEDGTDYEGSTSYHRLVAELFYHCHLIALEQGIPTSKNFVSRLQHMFYFIDRCTPKDSDLVMIGDNDSGKVLHYGITNDIVKKLQPSDVTKTSCTHFPNFGLSVIEKNNWHVTFRHHSYQQHQPSGHKHNDTASITLAVDGVEVLVDPGTYVYTPSVKWRNVMRSSSAHNAFHLDGIEPSSLNTGLFHLNIDEREPQTFHTTVNENISIRTDCTHYRHLGLQAERTITLEKNCLLVEDLWTTSGFDEQQIGCWTFTLSPKITIQKIENGFNLMLNEKPFLTLQSTNLSFEERDGFVSKTYGKVEECRRLIARNTIANGAKYVIKLFRIDR